MKPGVEHALIGLAIWAAVTAIALFVLTRLALPPQIAPWFGFTATTFAYLSRERRQSEEYYGSNRIPIWVWRPRAWRDMAWPILTSLAPTAVWAVDGWLGRAILAGVL